MFNFERSFQTVPQRLHRFTVSAARYEGFSFSASSLPLVITCLLTVADIVGVIGILLWF